MPTVVILSPHFDDAVLNCWSLIREPSTLVLTVFAGIPPKGTHAWWDRVCGQADSHQMMLMRRQENEAAVAISGNTNAQICLDYLDHQYHTGSPSAAELADRIEAASPKGCAFAAPLAISRLYPHPNHILVRQAGLELRRRGHSVLFYPDSPYMSLPRTPAESALRRVQTQAEKAFGFAMSVNVNELNAAQLKAKANAMHAYKTQYRMTNLTSLWGFDRIARRRYEVVLIPAPHA